MKGNVKTGLFVFSFLKVVMFLIQSETEGNNLMQAKYLTLYTHTHKLDPRDRVKLSKQIFFRISLR